MKSQTTNRSVFQLAAQSSERVLKFANQDHNASYINSISNGSIPLLHPDLHEFVDRSHTKNQSIYLRTYKPSKDRAIDAEIDYNQNHLHPGPYYQKEGYKRSENLTKEKPPLRYGIRTENQRLVESMNNLIDHTQRDMHMCHQPNWKPIAKEKWVSQNTFKANGSNFQSKSAWPLIPSRNPQDNYLFEEIIDDFKKIPNLKKPPFNPVIKKDPYAQYSTSIRTGKQDEAFGQMDKIIFSNNDRLKHYKSALIKTKSVDHIIPFNHSNNFQSIKNIFPDSMKQYLKSSEQMNLKLQSKPVQSLRILDGLDQEVKNLESIDEDRNPIHEKTTHHFRPQKPFKPYSMEETKQIVDRYFHKSIQ